MSEEFVKKVNGKRVAASEASPSSPLKTTLDGKVSKTGDTMSGRLTLQKTLSQVFTGTGTAASSSGSTCYPAKWKYDLGIATPVAGDQMVIQLPVAGSDYGVYLSTDNGTTYYPVAQGTGSARCTTRYPSGAYVCVVFETFVSGNNNAGRVTEIFPVAGGTSRTTLTTGCWRIVNDYDSGNNYDRLYNANGRFYAGATGCSSYSLVCLDNTGKYSKLISSGTGTGNTKTVNTSGKFVFPSSVLYYAADNTVAANTLVTSTYATYIAYPSLDMRYSTNYNTSSNPAFTANSPVYIECNINSDGTWSPTEKAITQTLVSGKYYIFLGITYSTAYQLSLAPNHPIFYYDGTNLVSALLTKNGISASSTNGNISVAGTDVTVYTHPTQTVYSAKGSATKVPKITTDSTGHVTSIEEVTISGVTPASHTHGNIQNGGTLQTNDVTIANGDKLVVTDSSDSNKIARTSVSFDGSTTTKALTPKGTFESFAKSGDITTAIQALDVSSVGGAGKYISEISETDGKISATATTMDTTPTENSTNAVTSGGIKTALGKKADKSSTVSNVVWSSSKLTKTINGTTTDVVSASTLKSAMSLNNVTNDAQVKRSEMGTASGVATLDANGIINTFQLPSYVDDVLEYSAKSQFPATGETGKIYVDTSTNLTWRWSGTTYVEISPSLALGETSSTAYRGDRGKAAYDHSQLTSGNPHNVTATDVKAVSYDTNSQGLTNTQKSNARTNINAQASLATQTAYTSKGSSTKVPQITTNTLGQVTGISEVGIAFPSGTQLVYDCGTGSTSTTDFDNAIAAYNAGNWVIIRKDGVIYHCVGYYNSNLRFKTFANESDLLKVRALTWTRGFAPTVGTTLEAALTSDISGKVNKSGDTMSDNLTISKGANQGDTKFVATRTDTGTTGWFGVGDGGQNHGVYSEKAYANTNNEVDNDTKGWVVRTDENGYSTLTGAVDGLFGKYFGNTETLRGMKRFKFGYSFDLEGDYTHVSATAIIEARLYSAGVSGGTITMLFNASAQGDARSYYRLQVLSSNNWNLNSVCPVLIVQQSSATAKQMILGFVSGGPTSTTLMTFNYTEVKVLPLNGARKFSWSFGWDMNDFNSNTMTMIKPYVYPRAQIGTAIGSSSSPLYVKNNGDFATANLIDRAVGVKDAGRADAPATGDATVKLGWSNSAVPACTPDGTSTYSAGSTVGTTKHLVTAYEYDGVAYYKDVQAANVKVGDSVKWGGYKIQVGSIGSDSSTIYFT